MSLELADSHKPRLLVLASTYPRWHGDPEPAFVHELARRLVGTFDVTVLGPHARGAARREVLDGVHVERYRYAPDHLELLVNDGGIMTNLRRRRWLIAMVPFFIAAQAWAMLRIVRRSRPHIIHAHWIIPQGLIVALIAALWAKVPPFLVTAHGADVHALAKGPFRWLQRLAIRRASKVTVVSNALRDAVGDIDATVQAIVEPMGVDMQARFTPSAEVRRSTDEILFVGRLVEKKGVRFLIDALAEVLQSHPRARLTIAGFGPEAASLREQVRALDLEGHVDFIGPVAQADLPSYYRRAAVFVAPFVRATTGDQEGLGLVAVEAAACGCALVLSDLPAVADVREVAPNARMVRPGSVPDLTAMIREALDEAGDWAGPAPEQLEGLRARFDWGSVAARYAALLQQAAAANPKDER